MKGKQARRRPGNIGWVPVRGMFSPVCGILPCLLLAGPERPRFPPCYSTLSIRDQPSDTPALTYLVCWSWTRVSFCHIRLSVFRHLLHTVCHHRPALVSYPGILYMVSALPDCVCYHPMRASSNLPCFYPPPFVWSSVVVIWLISFVCLDGGSWLISSIEHGGIAALEINFCGQEPTGNGY